MQIVPCFFVFYQRHFSLFYYIFFLISYFFAGLAGGPACVSVTGVVFVISYNAVVNILFLRVAWFSHPEKFAVIDDIMV